MIADGPRDVGVTLAGLFHAYDVRGPAPDQLDDGIAAAVGAAFADVVGISDGRGTAVVGRDARVTSGELSAAVVDGIRRRGADVIDIGLTATDVLYFASGRLDLPGVMVTASHNPARYNGLKLCRAGARPIGQDSGLNDIRAAALRWHGSPPASGRGGLERRDVLVEYGSHVRALVPVRGRRLRVVVDAANAMAAVTVPVVFAALDLEVVPLYFELDGRFPNHPADPLDPANLVALQVAVVDSGADVGLAFDGDADRCFVIDERAELVEPSLVAAVIAGRELARHPGARIIHNVVCSRVVPETIAAAGGVAVRTPVGHSLIKAAMAEHGAVFGGEHSGHFYFRDFWNADSGMLAALHVLAVLAESDQPLSAIAARHRRYVASGEINSAVSDTAEAMERVERAFSLPAPQLRAERVDVDHLDGLTVSTDPWWFNLRASNTEPLIRLNVEAGDREMMELVRDSVLAVVRSPR